MSKMIYLNNETFLAKAEITNYGKEPIQHINPSWKLSHADAKTIAEGKFNVSQIPFGLTQLGEIKQSLSSITKPEQLTVTINAGNFENAGHIWVYPALQPLQNEKAIKITQVFDAPLPTI